MLIFVEGGKWRTWRKTLEARERINNKLNSHMTLGLGIEPEITVVRGKRLAATPPMLPIINNKPLHVAVLLAILYFVVNIHSTYTCMLIVVM
jgi:hypothetical protein